MRNTVLLSLLLPLSFAVAAQELNCTVTVNADQVRQTNRQIFRTLEHSLTDFVNKNQWTTRVYEENERVNARLFLTVTQYENDRFEATLQIQSSRPVFEASYESPVFNYKDDAFTFRYQEFQPLVYNKNVFDSNLVGVIAYYVYIILGMDADTFSPEGGSEWYKKAQYIVTQAQSSGSPGWRQESGKRTRFELVDNLLNNTFIEYRIALYNYHRKGLDRLSSNAISAKRSIFGSLRLFETLVKRRPNAFLLQTFFDAKAEEIRDLFSDGPEVDLVTLKKTLNRVAPFYANTWNQIQKE